MLDRTLAIIQQGLSSRLHIGAQLSAFLHGQPAATLSLGVARLAPDSPTHTDVPMTPDTLMLWLSAGKPITAVAVAMLKDRGLLTWDTPVADLIPEFAAHGKHVITLRHLLTHTAGLRALDTAYPFASWQQTLQKIYDMKIERDWSPGQKAGYHTHTSWYLLGEIINRLTGTPHDLWIRQNIFLPLKMKDTYLAMPPETYHAYATRIGYLYDTTPPKTPPNSPTSTPVAHPIKNYDTELAVSRPRPSASLRAPARDLARFYEMLRLHGTLDGVTLLTPQTVAEITSRQRLNMFDHTFRQTIDWGLGFIINSSHHGSAIPYQFGPLASPDTFGHGGSQSSTAFCDPKNQLTVALLFNGSPGEAPHDKRLRATLRALYEDLHLT